MNDDQTPINDEPQRRRRLPAAVEDIAVTLEDKLFWRFADNFKAVFEVVRWPFERIGWALQQRLIWPLQDRASELDGPGRVLAVGGGGGVIAVVAVGALALATSGGSGSQQAATPVAVAPKPVAKVSTPPAPKPKAPTLHGAAPVFKAPARKSSSEVDPAKPIETSSPQSTSATSSSAATGKISSNPSSSTSSADAARASTVEGPPAGEKAIAVAREFSGAFVIYETGGEKAEVGKAFATTATPELSKALLKRPPRLPANVKVPKAKVLNVVAGPSHGGVYTLSVSLLRVGVTSELRLEMEKLKGEGWRVTNVLG